MFEEGFSSYITTGLICAVVALFVWKSTQRPKGIPPGPLLSLPLVGNLLEFGKNPLTTFSKMRAKYGDIFSVYFGNRLVIVINGYENLKEAFGKRFEYNDRKFLKFLKLLQESMSVSRLMDFLPILRFFPGDFLKIKRTISNLEQTNNELIIPIIEEHEKNYDEDNIDDFISAYIKEIKSKESAGEENTSMDRENLVVTIGDLFLAGTETSSTTIRWLLLCFLYFPEIQEKCFSEIKSVVGSSRPVTLKDKSQLPYIEATVLEALRFGNIVPLGAPHTTSVDTEFKGYTFPKGVIILTNLESVLHDPEIWGDPENFRPERYIDEDGNVIVPEEHIPFFIERRKCLGEALARMELFLFISNMIQKFKFVKVEGDTLPSLEGEFGQTHSPESNHVRIIPRD